MNTNNQTTSLYDYATAFSRGDFDYVYPVMHDDIVWEIFGQQQLQGKQSVIDYCKQVANYFASVETDFHTYSVVESGSAVAVNGHAIFTREGKKVSELDAADFYEFDEAGQLKRIRSYCINIESGK